VEVRIEQKRPFQVAGLTLRNTEGANFPQLWEDLFAAHTMEELLALGSGQSYGSCFSTGENDPFTYMAGFDCQDKDKAKALGLELLDVPAARYAVVTLHGPIPQCIHAGWQYVWETWLPGQGYRQAGTPDFELYFLGDMHNPDYQMELWVPIVKA